MWEAGLMTGVERDPFPRIIGRYCTLLDLA